MRSPAIQRTALILLIFFSFMNKGNAQGLTNMGTDFWIAFPKNYYIPELRIYISAQNATTGTITSAYGSLNQPFSVVPGIVTQVIIPPDISLEPNVVENKGIHIISSGPVAVYGLSYYNVSTDAFMAIPVPALDTSYQILSYNALANILSSLAVVATQNGTNVTIHKKQTNTTTEIVLNQGQTYYTGLGNSNDDISGSTVTADKPVSVFGSNECADIPLGCFAADYLVEQMFPTYALGKNFIAVQFGGRDDSGDIFRILAIEDQTAITINGVTVATIDKNEFHQVTLDSYSSINTSKPCHVFQYAKGLQCSGNITGDPFMLELAPREQFLNSYTVATTAGFAYHWVNIIASQNAMGTIYQDGVLIPASSFVQVPGTTFYGSRRAVTEGSHTYTGAAPFGVSIYGWNNINSYGYSGGCSFSNVTSVTNVSITPDTAYGTLNVTNMCFTATVTNNLNNPVPNILVDFIIDGINPVTGNGFTNSNGQVDFCYTQTGTIPGVDSVYAIVSSIPSNISRAFWTNIPCNNPTNGGSIGSSQIHCGSFTPAPLTNVTSPSGQTGVPEYLWQSSTIGNSSGFTDIAGSNSAGYSPGIVTQTTWFRRLCRVECMSGWIDAAVSNVIEMTVNPEITAGISIAALPDPYCEGLPVTITATPSNGGNAPSFQWKVNGSDSGTNSSIFTYLPSPGDVILCYLTSDLACVINNPVQSSSLIMKPDTSHRAGIIITPDHNPFCSGTNVIFNATAINGGLSPAYQWKVNGVAAGTNSSILQITPLNGDQIQCLMTSNLYCVSGNPAASLNITLNEKPSPVVSVNSCFDTITTTNAKPFLLRGGIPLGGNWSGPGVNGITGMFSPSIAGSGLKNITYSYTNSASCTDARTMVLDVRAPAQFTCGNPYTDIRDNKTYQTIKIGSQCWFAENLRFGIMINSNQHQRDNCFPEKYCLNNVTANCELTGNFYQWDELMQYTDTPGEQGLCPAGWHVPTEPEWQMLLNNWTNGAFAASYLKYSGFSGFNALLTGAAHQNTIWKYQDFAAFYWTSTPHGVQKAVSHGMNETDPSISTYYSSRQNAFSVRCLAD